MIEIKHVLNVLKQVKEAIETNNTSRLKDLSNQTIHSASTKQDEENVSLAVTIYSLGKIFERQNYRTLGGWNDFNRLFKNALDNSIKYLEKNDLENYKKNFALIGKAINKISGKLKTYIEQVFEKAKINKASKMYEHGISLGKTASLLGVSLYDLAGYTGNIEITDIDLSKTIEIKERIKLIEEFFK